MVKDIFSIIRRINDDGVTVLLIEQNANAAFKIADRGYVLQTGNVTMTGTGMELLNDESIKEAYLGKEVKTQRTKERHKNGCLRKTVLVPAVMSAGTVLV